MAAIPVTLYFGDVMITGGAQPDTQPPTVWGQFLNNWKFARVKPSSPNGVTPPIPQFDFLPYWDGSGNSGAGLFTKYYYIGGGLIGPKGDNWFLPAGGGITPCTMLCESLWERHFQAPGFKLLKYAQPSAGYGSWKPGGAAFVAAKAEWDKMVAAVALEGHTLVVESIVLDCSATDILAESPTFESDAQACITGLRTTYSPTAPIVVVSHRPDFALNVPGAAKAARVFHKNLRSLNPGVHVFDMSFAQFGRDGIVGGTEPGPNNTTYETIDYLDAGTRIGRLIGNLLSNTTLAETDGPMALDVFIGDSNFITYGMDAAQVVAGKQESLLGTVGGTQREGEWIYDDANEQVVPYDVMGVTNSIGVTQEHFFGPEATYQKRMREEVPNAQRCTFKFAVGGANLGALDSVWDDVVAMWRRCLAAIVRDTGRVPDVTSINLNFGHNDGLAESTADVFDLKVLQMIDQARELFTTRADGKPTPLNWVQNAPHQGNGWAKGTLHGEASSNERVRQTIAGLPKQRPNVRVLLNGDPATKRLTFELQREDKIHLGGEATYGIGYGLADLTLAAMQEDATDADQVGGEEPTQLVEPVVDTSPAGIVRQLERAIAEGGDVASYTTATGQQVQLRGFTEILSAIKYFEGRASRQQGIRRTRVRFT